MRLLDGINDTEDELYTFDSIMEIKTTSKGLEAWKRLHSEMPDKYWYGEQFDKDEEIIEKELKDKAKFEELVGMDLDLFMKAVDIKGLIEDYQKFKKALEVIKNKQVNVENFVNTCSKMSYEQYKFMWEEGCFMGVKMVSKEFLTKEEYDLLKEVLL